MGLSHFPYSPTLSAPGLVRGADRGFRIPLWAVSASGCLGLSSPDSQCLCLQSHAGAAT